MEARCRCPAATAAAQTPGANCQTRPIPHQGGGDQAGTPLMSTDEATATILLIILVGTMIAVMVTNRLH